MERLEIGARVYVEHNVHRDRGYTAEAIVKRGRNKGRAGTVLVEHDSHGLCYEVLFEGGTVVTYDREELEVIA